MQAESKGRTRGWLDLQCMERRRGNGFDWASLGLAVISHDTVERRATSLQYYSPSTGHSLPPMCSIVPTRTRTR